MPCPKLLILFIVLSGISHPSIAQETIPPKKKNNEVFLNVFSFKNGYGNVDESDYVVSFFNGLGFKQHIGKHAIRLGFNYKDDQHNFQYESYGNISYREGKFNLGYQFTLLEKSVQPYIATDIFYLIGKYESESHGGWWGDRNSMQDLDKNGIGFGPAIGVKFLLPKSISLTFEGNLEFLWVHSKGTITKNEYPDANPLYTYPVDRTGFTVLLNPLNAFSLNYDF